MRTGKVKVSEINDEKRKGREFRTIMAEGTRIKTSPRGKRGKIGGVILAKKRLLSRRNN